MQVISGEAFWKTAAIYYLLVFIGSGVIAFPESANSQECRSGTLEQRAVSLDLSKVESVVILANEFEKKSKETPPACVDTLFLEFRKLYYQALTQYQEKTDLSAGASKDLKATLNSVGWEQLESEGYYYLGEDGTWFIRKFAHVLNKPMLRYLERRKLETKEKFSEDAALLISWETLRKRIGFWEPFLKQNPNFVFKDEINSYLDIYIRTFLTCLDNSQITKDFNDPSLRNDVKAAYEAYIQKNKDSRYHETVAGYYETLKRAGFVVTEESEKYLAEHGIKSMRAIQPPTY